MASWMNGRYVEASELRYYERSTEAAREAVNAFLRGAIDIIKRTAFCETHEATDDEALGLAIAHYFKWDDRIVRCAARAMEDANFHRLAGPLFDQITEWDNEDAA